MIKYSYATIVIVLMFLTITTMAVGATHSFSHDTKGNLIAMNDTTREVTVAAKDDLDKRGTENVTDKSIILLGASYAAGLKLEQIGDHHLVNKGVGGEQSFEMLARFDADVLSHKPDMVIVWGFINDITRADQSKIDATLERVKMSYVDMIAKARQNGVKVVLTTEITMSLRPGIKETLMAWIAKILGKSSYQDAVNRHVMDLNNWLKKYAAENDLPLLDLQAVLSDGGIMRKKKYAQKDGSHVSEMGYQVISEYITVQLSTLK